MWVHVSLCVVTHLFFLAISTFTHVLSETEVRCGEIHPVLLCRFHSPRQFFVQARGHVKQFGQGLGVRGEDQRIDIVSGWWCYRGYSKQGRPAVASHPPQWSTAGWDSFRQSKSDRNCVWTGVISRTLLNEWGCMNSAAPPLSVFSHGFKASHCSEPTFLFTSALM